MSQVNQGHSVAITTLSYHTENGPIKQKPNACVIVYRRCHANPLKMYNEARLCK